MLAKKEIEVIILPSKANLYSFFLFFFNVLLFGFLFSLIWGFSAFVLAWKEFLTQYFRLAITMLTGMALHEGIHALVWAAYCKNSFRSVKFGVNWKNLSPYVQCNEDMLLLHYTYGVLMPGVVLGILPAVISVIIGNGWLLCFGIFFISGAAGDFFSYAKLRTFSRGDRVRDHPEHLGFIVTPSGK
jgi:hypothetical protein